MNTVCIFHILSKNEITIDYNILLLGEKHHHFQSHKD